MNLFGMTKNLESEKTLEARLVEEVKNRGGIAVKLTSQFHRGMPDRLILLPFHTMCFVEMKSTGKKPEPLQVAAMAQLRQMHFPVRVVDSTEGLDELLATLDSRVNTATENLNEYKEKKKELKKEFQEKKKEVREAIRSRK